MKKIFKKTYAVVVLLIVFTMGLIGCDSSNNVSKDNNNNSAIQQEVSYPMTIADSDDKEVVIEQEPNKIVSVAPNITEIIFELGAQDKLVGRTQYCDYPEGVSNIESIGTLTTPDIEKIIGLEPDLVITSTHFNEDNTAKLESVGIKVISLYEEHDVNGVYKMIETLGKALNKEKKANETVNKMKKTISEVEQKVKDLEMPTVYYVVGYGEFGDFSAPENTFVGQLINLAGGKDIVPASDSWSYSLEALLESDPQIIVVKNGEKENFISAEGYKELTAVKQGKVYEIDNNLLDRQGNRNAEGVLKLAEIFHSEAFK